MTPTEKAKELVDKFIHPVRWKMGQEDVIQRAKQCALISAEETISALQSIWHAGETVTITSFYWRQVKQEIEKL